MTATAYTAARIRGRDSNGSSACTSLTRPAFPDTGFRDSYAFGQSGTARRNRAPQSVPLFVSAPPPSAKPLLPCFACNCSKKHKSFQRGPALRLIDKETPSYLSRTGCTLSSEPERDPTSSSFPPHGIAGAYFLEIAFGRNRAKLQRRSPQNGVENPSCLLLGEVGGVVTFPTDPRSKPLKN